MSKFGQRLFGGSGFIRWTLSTCILIFAVVLPLLVESWTPARLFFMTGVELMCLTLLAGFWLPSRYGHWAFRGLAGLVFLAYAAYLVYEFFFTDKPFRIAWRRSEDSPFNALLGFIIVGLPSLWYSLFGRFTLRPTPPESAEDIIESNNDAT
ncbi:MAG: hypothetical protein WCS94_19595 [Verrucomicrobiota bacterium]